jgi:hypothetical protein
MNEILKSESSEQIPFHLFDPFFSFHLICCNSKDEKIYFTVLKF